jgi:glycosyltransferase involved in cell wall biosynthesis
MMYLDTKDISILFVPFGSSRAPATRYRAFQYIPYLSSRGVRYKVFSSISARTTAQMIQSPRFIRLRKYTYYLQLNLERVIRFWAILFLAARYKILFLQRTTFPFRLERLLKKVNKNIIFDIDDSIYIPDREEAGLVAQLKKYIKMQEVISILRVSRCVIVENTHIKNFVQKYCNKICLITGPIDTVKNYVSYSKPLSDEITIGWIGSPSTILYFKMIDEVLRRLSAKYSIKIRLIGVGDYSIEGANVETVVWSEETEVLELHKFDIGVMPMPDNEWTRGKVGCKMLQYMANAIPAVVSYTSTNSEIIEDGVNGYLVQSEAEWEERLSRLIEDSNLRKRIGLGGRKTVEERFSLEVNAPRFLDILWAHIR